MEKQLLLLFQAFAIAWRIAAGTVYILAIPNTFLANPGTNIVWEERLSDLDTWMRSVGKYPAVRVAIIDSFTAWRYFLPPPSSSPDPRVANALLQQTNLGWDSAYEGRFVPDWLVIQESYYCSTPSKSYHNGLRWLSLLIRKLFDISWGLWKHLNAVLHKRTDGIFVGELCCLVSH